MSWVKWIWKGPAKVVTLPVKGVKKVTQSLYTQLALMVLRHGLTALGAGGIVSNDDMTQVVGAVATAIGLAWSAWRKIQTARKTT